MLVQIKRRLPRFIVLMSVLFSCLPIEAVSDVRTIRVLQIQSEDLIHNNYYGKTLSMALDKSVKEHGPYEIVPVDAHMRQKRQFVSLNTNLIDVVWTGTSAEREKLAQPIRIPLLKGMLGHRVFVIRKTDLNKFRSLNSLQELAKLRAVQGLDWPDVDALKHAGLKVEDQISRNSLYKMVSNKIVDYHPRSTMEILDEFRGTNDPALAIEQKHLLVYPAAMYFFVRTEDTDLANRLTTGLRNAIADGSFDEHFLSFPSHREALKLFYDGKRVIHRLENPFMSPETPYADRSLWTTLPANQF